MPPRMSYDLSQLVPETGNGTLTWSDNGLTRDGRIAGIRPRGSRGLGRVGAVRPGVGEWPGMATTMLRIGIAGCGLAARAHLDQFRAIEGVRVVGLADPDLAAAEALAAQVPVDESGTAAAAFADHRDLLREIAPDALAVFTPHREHYRPVMDALQAGCHVFVEKPLSTNVQEAADIVGLARGRDRKVGVGHQYRLLPSLIEARRRLASGAIGTIRLVTATLARPWLASQSREAEGSWRFDPKVAGGGLLTDAGDHLLDALLWTTGRAAVEVAAFQ